MNTVTLPSRDGLAPAVNISRRSNAAELLVLTEDDRFWEKLSAAACAAGRELVRNDTIPQFGKRDRSEEARAVLLDLDCNTAWETADRMLRDEHAPRLVLITSRGEHPDWNSAVQAGTVLDKRTDAAGLLRQINTWLSVPGRLACEIKSEQRFLIRWLKPCAEAIPSRRFYGINE